MTGSKSRNVDYTEPRMLENPNYIKMEKLLATNHPDDEMERAGDNYDKLEYAVDNFEYWMKPHR